MSSEIVSLAPATGEELWRAPVGDVNDAVERARRAWPAWAAQPLATRIELVRRFANEVRKEMEPFSRLLARETGQPLWEAREEVDLVIRQVEFAVRSYAERTAQRRLDGAMQGSSAVRHKPHGVMAAITPFASPAAIPNGMVAPALIAGNAVILKASEKAPATAELLVRCYRNAGVPANVIQLLVGGPETGQALAVDDGVDGVLFAGSTQAGVMLNTGLAASPGKIVSLSLSGNNPLVVWDTAKIEDAAALVIQSAFSGGGQRCTNARRLIVRSELYDAVIGAVKALADRIVVGGPFDEPAPFMGAMIDNATAEDLTESFVFLLSNGGRPIKHMVRPEKGKPFLTPAIIDVTAMADRPDLELFGPLLQVIRVDDFDQAIAVANDTRYGLVAGLIGGTPQEYNRFWANARAGVVNWNRPTTAATPGAPFGGVGLSGNNRAGGFYTADHCAYPVASAEMEQPRTTIGVGLRDP